jgi:two-component system chemotaxis response regulator CheY
MRALIVDDSPVMRKVVERALRQAGIELSEVIQAGSGNEALEVLRPQPGLDLILSDINMPGMDGLQFLERLRSEGLAPGVPCIMITTESSAPVVHRAIAAGADGYICKPFTPDQIRARVMPLLLRWLESA